MKAFQMICAVVLAGWSAVAAAVGGLAELSVYDRSEGRKLPVYWHEGRAWVVGRPGNEYQLHLRNRQGEDLLAVLSVDGINAISGEIASARQSGYVLSPGGSLDVKGWRKDLARTAAFYFTTLADSYAARTGRPDHVGAIGVALFRRKHAELEIGALSRRREAPAAAESRAADQGAKLGTGHGRSETSYARQVGFERATREPAETVVIYYDSYRNLLARGIIPSETPPRRPWPNPFPGFVPDPPA